MHFHIFIFGLLFLVTTRPTTAGLISINGISPSKSTMTNSCDVSASSCSLKCTRESNCQGLGVEEKIWAIECDGNSCHDLTARCSKGQSCSVSCNGLSACQGAVFHGKWQITCDGESACQDVTIMEIDQTITCNGISSCEGLSVTCTEGQSCSAVCREMWACHRARFEGKWQIDCYRYSCKDVTIREINQLITCNGMSSCEALSVTCTEGHSCSALLCGMWVCERARFEGKWNLDCRGLDTCNGQLLDQTEEEEY